jgi:predicted MPP superfamily phosphohydrolase
MPETQRARASARNGRLRVAALGDLHASATVKGKWRDTFTEISHEANVLCLCGDLTNLGTRPEAESLAEDLRACTIPVVAVLGNHDHHCGKAEEIEHVLCSAGVKFLEDDVHTIDGVGFAGVITASTRAALARASPSSMPPPRCRSPRASLTHWSRFESHTHDMIPHDHPPVASIVGLERRIPI